MRRKRATARFYVFLLLLCAGAFFLVWRFFPRGYSEAIVQMAKTSNIYHVDSVIVRDESVVSYEGGGRVVYLAAEGAAVKQGDEIAEIYSANYSEKVMGQLDTIRQNIRTYHQTILTDIVDAELERLEKNVQAKAVELKTILSKKTAGNFMNVEKQLEQAMLDRQNYLSQKRREDQKLTQLYDEERKQINAIAAWRRTETAARDGIVSFYLDGCERFLSPDNLTKLTAADVRSILAGNKPETEETSRFQQAVYRLIVPDKWYVLLISTTPGWNPVNGQEYSFQIEEFEDLVYSGTVVQVQKEGDEVMAQLEIHGDIMPMINQRSGRALVSIDLSDLSVPIEAIAMQNGQTGVWINDVPGGTFIPVEVLSSDAENALIQPVVENSIVLGQKILIK